MNCHIGFHPRPSAVNIIVILLTTAAVACEFPVAGMNKRISVLSYYYFTVLDLSCPVQGHLFGGLWNPDQPDEGRLIELCRRSSQILTKPT